MSVNYNWCNCLYDDETKKLNMTGEEIAHLLRAGIPVFVSLKYAELDSPLPEPDDITDNEEFFSFQNIVSWYYSGGKYYFSTSGTGFVCTSLSDYPTENTP